MTMQCQEMYRRHRVPMYRKLVMAHGAMGSIRHWLHGRRCQPPLRFNGSNPRDLNLATMAVMPWWRDSRPSCFC